MNNFKEYGFEADFEGEILKQIGDILYGVIYVEYFGRSVVCEWNTKGKVISEYKIDKKAFELEPIKKEWYENPDNFPCLVYHSYDNSFHIAKNIMTSKEGSRLIEINNEYRPCDVFRPATKEEVLSLLLND